MPTDPTRIINKQVRVIFPDGLPRGLDPSQDVQLVVRNPKRESPDGKQSRDSNGAAANDRAAEQFPQQNRDGTEASPNHPTAPLPAQNGRKADALVRELAPQPVQPSERSAEPDNRSGAVPPNEPEPAAAETCPPAAPHSQDDSVRLPSASCLLPSGLLPSPHKLSRADAARENGRKSRGPVTPEGKARSSQNALKHGLSSRRIVIGTEDEEEWREFRDECRETLRPLGAIELGYADEFAASRWRLNRCLGIETSIFDHEFALQKIYDAKRCSQMDDIAKTGKAFRSAQDNLTALGRYETRIRRSGERALANLLKLRSMRQNEPEMPAAPDDSTEPTTLQSPPISNPQKDLSCDPSPEPVQPSECSAATVQNEPENRPHRTIPPNRPLPQRPVPY